MFIGLKGIGQQGCAALASSEIEVLSQKVFPTTEVRSTT